MIIMQAPAGPSFVRQRMNKSGNQTGMYYNSANAGNRFVGPFVSDPTHPAVVATTDRAGDSLVIQGDGTVTIHAEVAASASIQASPVHTFALELNGVAVASDSSSLSSPYVFTLTASGVSVQDGDIVQVRLTAGPPSGSGGATTVAAAGTYIDVNAT